MRFIDYYLQEKKGSEYKNLIVVDVQPLYEDNIKFDMNEFVDFILSIKKKILWFYNGPKYNTNSKDTELKIKKWLTNFNINIKEMDWSKVKFIDKSYSFFARWMNEPIFLKNHSVIQVIRYMYLNKINNSAKIPRDVIKDMISEEEFKKLEPHIDKEEYRLSIPEMIKLDVLKSYDGSLIVGGKQNECLKEIQVLMSAFNIKYTVADKFTYV
jgi:hypothetical protein